MRFRVGPGSGGYNYLPEFIDLDCTVTIPASGTLNQGQPVFYSMINIPSTAGADKVLPAPSANNAQVAGIYLGATVTNPSSTATLTQAISIRAYGYAQIYAQVTASGTGSSAIVVGSNLIAAPNTAGLVGAYAGTAGFSVQVGIAYATGSALTAGATIMAASTAATQLINGFVNVL